MSELAKRIAALSPEKLALAWSRLHESGKNAFVEPSIPRRKAPGPCPTSFAQQRLWFLNQFEPASPFYNITSLVRIVGPLNPAALEQSFSEIIRRHDVLRTTFAAPEGNPLQVITPARRWDLPTADLRALPPAVRQGEVGRLIREEAAQPFDLAAGPLMRVLRLQPGEQECFVVVTVHHIVSDDWSSGVLFRELASLYQACSAGTPVPLPELPIQYADFARWQRTSLQGDVLERQLQFWKARVTRAPVLELPTDRPRPPVQSFRGATHTFEFPRRLSESLGALSRQAGATLFMTLLAAFQTLIHRYTGERDISVGTPVANRNNKDLEALLGFFVNTLVLRNDLSGDPSFRRLLNRVRQSTLEAFSHQDLPFEKLVEAVQPERVLSHSPLFQVMFALTNTSLPAPAFAGLTMTPLPVDSGTSQFDLTLLMANSGQELTGSLNYNVDLFDGTTIGRMRGHWVTLLEGIVADPDQTLSDLPVWTRPECHQVLVEWNDTDADYALNSRLHDRLEAQAERAPDAVAVASENEQWTYRTLNERANQLAHHLRALGLGPGGRVAVCMEQSFDMTVALAGILKAGAAYLPLDPKCPKARLSFMLEDAQAELVLTQQDLLAGIPEHRARTICLDADWTIISRASQENPAGGSSPEHSAYVTYTSGSTGTPKGVMISHRGICNRLQWMQEAYRLTPTDHVLQKTPATFDVSVWEFFWPLSNGARLVLSQPDGYKDSAYLARAIAEQEITRVHFVPAMLDVFLEEQGLERCRCLRQVICSGEVLPLDVQARFFDRFDADLHNLYGPTEASIDVTSWTCRRDNPHPTVPIGRPIANTHVYVLDSSLQPVPIGVFGELHLGGMGLSHGYLNRPELTARQFIPNPYGKEPGSVLYKTGDIGRFLADGNIEFLGRADNQIKIRGFRIEPEEIEARLGEHDAVRQCKILVRTDVTDGPLLVAYLVANDRPLPSPAQLRGFLKDRLPDYMVPSAFVVLDALPLTPNGKVDDQALPVPDRSRSGLETVFMPPRSPVEKLLTGIWSEVLGLAQVGVHDNFFALGGHSISSIQIVARAHRMGLRLTPKEIFQHPTVAELAAVADPLSAIHGQHAWTTSAAPLTPAQHWFFEQGFVNPHSFQQTILLDTRQALDPGLLHKSVECVWAHHDALRIRFVREKSGWQQIEAGTGTTVPFTRVDLSTLPEREQESALEHGRLFSLNLSDGPLMRAALVHRGANRPDRLVMTIHNLVIDEASWRILLDDVQTVYRQMSDNEAIELAPRTASFAHWSNWLTAYAHSPECGRQLDYWLARSAPTASPLPVEDVTGLVRTVSASNVRVSLDVQETSTLSRRIPEIYRVHVTEALLAILAQTLSRWTGNRSLLIDVMGNAREADRDGIDVSRTVGCFAARFPVLLDLGETHTAEDSLRTTKEQVRAIPNRGIGYGALRYLSGKAELADALAALPQSDVSFAYRGDWDEVLRESPLFTLVGVSAQPAGWQPGPRQGLQIAGHIAGGQLHVDWAFDGSVHGVATIDGVARDFLEALRGLIASCSAATAAGYTPSDFPKARLSQKDLDKVVARVSQVKGAPLQ